MAAAAPSVESPRTVLNIDGETHHALFVRSTCSWSTDTSEDKDSPPFRAPYVVRKERGPLPRIETAHLPALRQLLGMGEDDWTACPIPGHDGMASIDLVDDSLSLWCDCLGGQRTVTVELRSGGSFEKSVGDAWSHRYSLADVYFAVQTGTTLARGFRTKYRGAYRLLLNADLGLIDSPEVDLPDAPLSERASVAADLFKRLYGAQIGAGFPDPGGMAVGLVAQWLGCGRGEAHEAIRELVRAGVIRQRGKLGRSHLYEPGLEAPRSPAMQPESTLSEIQR